MFSIWVCDGEKKHMLRTFADRYIVYKANLGKWFECHQSELPPKVKARDCVGSVFLYTT